MAEKLNVAELTAKPKAGFGAYLALVLAIILFSGVFYKMGRGYEWLGALDFSTIAGKFGSISGTNFVGKGGVGARQGFLFALTLFAPVTLAVGLLTVLEHYGALRAAQVLLTPCLRPILDIPGYTGLALVTDLQSTDAGAAISKSLYDNKLMNDKELTIMAAWQYCGAGCVGNYFSTVSALFAFFLAPVWKPLAIILVMKFVGGFFVRVCLSTIYRKDFTNGFCR